MARLPFPLAVGALLVACGDSLQPTIGNVTITDLGTLGWTISEAVAINNRGQILGVSYTAGDSAFHAVLWDTHLQPATSRP